MRALDIKPLRGIVLEARGGPVGDRLSCRVRSEERSLLLTAGGTGEARFLPHRGFPYYETFLYVVHCSSADGAAGADGRRLGSFVTLRLEVE